MLGFSIKQYDFSEAGKVNVANEKKGKRLARCIPHPQ